MSPAAPRPPVIASNPTFAGHQTFALRSGWLKKGMDAIQSGNPEDPEHHPGEFFHRPDALVVLGVGKNMVQSIGHWLTATRMARDTSKGRGRILEPTELGQALFGGPEGGGWDPFLEDEATLWLLHWQLASAGSPAFTWVWTFNYLRDYDFTKDQLVDAVTHGAASRIVKVPSRETIDRDVQCMLNCYVEAGSSSQSEDDLDCPLRGLHLIHLSFGRQYRLQAGEKPTLPLEVFCYALTCFWSEFHAASFTLSVRDLTYAEGSPGRVFKLDEDSVFAYLDEVERVSGGALRFEDSALSRQVVRDRGQPLQPLSFLELYFAPKSGQSYGL